VTTGRSDLVELTLHQHHETRQGEVNFGAYLVSDDGEREGAVWLPKSQCERGRNVGPGVFEFEMPEWLATDKGLL